MRFFNRRARQEPAAPTTPDWVNENGTIQLSSGDTIHDRVQKMLYAANFHDRGHLSPRFELVLRDYAELDQMALKDTEGKA